MDKRNDINEFRKKRRLRRVRLNIAILVLFGLIALFIALNWGKIIAPLKDAALDVGKGGFPVDLPGSTDYVLDELGDNFCLLTDTYFYTYNSDGAMITSAQHDCSPRRCRATPGARSSTTATAGSFSSITAPVRYSAPPPKIR